MGHNGKFFLLTLVHIHLPFFSQENIRWNFNRGNNNKIDYRNKLCFLHEESIFYH